MADAQLTVRAETPADHEAIARIQCDAFDGPLQAELVDGLRTAADPQVSLVAEAAGEPVGHIFFSPVTIEGTGAEVLAAQLSPVAVAPDHQGRGIGGALIRAGLDACRDVGWRAVFLVGNPVYYARFGFEMAPPLGFTHPGPHGPALQVIELSPGALASKEGVVHFHPVFAELGAD